MAEPEEWTVTRRPDGPPTAPWSIYSPRRGRWINVPFSDELDAQHAASVLAAASRGPTA